MQFLIKRIYLLFPLLSWIQINSVNFYRNHQARKQKKDTLFIFLRFFVSVRRQETLQCDIWPSEFISSFLFDLGSKKIRWIFIEEARNHQKKRHAIYLSSVTRFFVSVRRQGTLQRDIWPSEFIQFYPFFFVGSWIRINWMNFYRKKEKQTRYLRYLFFVTRFFLTMRFLTKRIYLLFRWILDPNKLEEFLSKKLEIINLKKKRNRHYFS